ncbi:polysaccharide export outer membrane protein [Sphingopyxis panaciterrae]|uniref:polysaccharide biosynthesis/export family protein n=1 Tax=Sphingopyxis panaciterrae TaxID=363841 RepID=UPI001422C6EB|nr:polysaccharide biosynthesis/export family protein [Sphingopyxis panaciterrae]NIJ38694.1 polysaccharide export outer membrane protein [Sphingopyxis panaciterrae]
MKKHIASKCWAGAICLSLTLSACAIAPSSGPSARSINRAAEAQGAVAGANISIIDVTDAVARRVSASSHLTMFSEELGQGNPIGSVIGKGDVLDIAIWEAPPATLFGAVGGDARVMSSAATARGTSLPEQMVDSDGQISVPFVGRIQADGKTPQQIASVINARLVGMAHHPQTIVRLVRNAAANVTIVGDVAGSARVPLTSRGERVLDVLAAAGGARQPVSKTTIQITRGSTVASLPLATVIQNPLQNVRLQPDDVVTVLFQPYSFTALGATGRNDEIPFEATGLTLAQALGRIAGLQDGRADVKGAFIFRLEDPDAVDPAMRATASMTEDGKVPVIYRINMNDPSTFFVAQTFPIRNRDVIYVSNAPLADIQKFLNVVSSTLLPAATTAAVISQQ